MTRLFLASLFSLVVLNLAAAGPYFAPGEDPAPQGKVWKPVDALSDEFDGLTVDAAKWQTEPAENGWKWIGRPPGLFKAENVTVGDGKLRVTVSKLDQPVTIKGNTFTHQGAIVRSLAPGQVGWYYECKMKANRTEMSSTFWLMGNNQCEKKLELDIQECVGRTSAKTEKWGRNWNQIFHSNLIHRETKCHPEKVQLQASVKPPTENWERYYVYAAWWKSPEEVRFYLDGKYAYSIRPKVAWDQPAWIQMAVETYSWNPLPDDGGLVESGTWEERTTQYEWVRTWKLE